MDHPNFSNPQDPFQSPPPQLPPYGFPVQPLDGATTPPNNHKGIKRRKLSQYDAQLKTENGHDEDIDDSGLQGNGSARKSRPAGTKRACNQCRQQKLKCNVQENPWKPCDRCTKHKLECVITADFKRVGKRSQQAELERSNEELKMQVMELSRALAGRNGGDGTLYEQHLRGQLNDRSNIPSFTTPPPAPDDSHDAALLLNLKQSDPNRATPMGRATPLPGGQQQLGSVVLTTDIIESLWAEFFGHYHHFMPILDPSLDTPDHILMKSSFLFWTVIFIASRHFPGDSLLFARLLGPYEELLKSMLSRPPMKDQHHGVKAFCLLCSWPIPATSTTEDMTFVHSGIMMKFAMHLGLHRPSSPADFSNIPVQLRQDQVTDRLRTWAFCNLVAQNVSTSYGQPPETVWDETLFPNGNISPALASIEKRLRIEQEVNKITKGVYLAPTTSDGVAQAREQFNEATINAGLNSGSGIELDYDNLYLSAALLHLDLQVFFENHDYPRYEIDLQQLHRTTTNFLAEAFKFDLQYAPNYIMQMCIAAVVALLKLLNSFFGFAEYADREVGVEMFWNAINRIRTMSVRQNDLPQRLAEVFAQMWNAWDTLNADREPIAESVVNGEIDSSLTLKRRYRMSMSHVFDTVWRWKEEMHGKREKLEEAIKNPTSPIATSHSRSSFSNGRRPSSSMLDEMQQDPNNPSTMAGFGGFGGMQMADMNFATSYDFFDPMGFYLNNDMPGSGGGMPDAFNPTWQ